jgi:hypothetical protein
MQQKSQHQFAMRPCGPLAAMEAEPARSNGPLGQVYLEFPEMGLVIAPKGKFDVEALFRGLPLALAVARECHGLKVDVSQAHGLDDLAVSALVVLLRNYARGFGHIVLQGLPPWAVHRFRDIGVNNLLGREWGCGLENDQVRYWRWKV